MEKEISQIDKINYSSKNYKYVYKSGTNKFKKIGNWLEKESNIFKKETENTEYKMPSFKRRDIIKVDFGINVGSELSNTHFAIVLNSDDNNSADNVTVIPLSSKPGYKRIDVGNILKDFKKDNKYIGTGYALITQIRTISKKRIFNTRIKSRCSPKTFSIVMNEIINYFTK